MDAERIVPTIGQPGARARMMEAGNRAVAERRRVEAERERIAAIRAEARERVLAERRAREAKEAAEAAMRAVEALLREAKRIGCHPATLIIRDVATAHGLTRADLQGRSRRPHIVRARQEAFYRIAKETGASLPEIGRRLGGRDHTTILWGIRRHAARLAAEAQS